VRIYPQDQNTGGFFISLIRKVSDMPRTTLPTTAATEDCESTAEKAGGAGEGEEEEPPVVFDPQLKHLMKELVGRELRGTVTGPEQEKGPETEVDKAGEGEKTEEVGVETSRKKEKRKRVGKEEPFLPLKDHMLDEWRAAK